MGQKNLWETCQYDDALRAICLKEGGVPFFGKLHPELLPYVGARYSETGVLLIGESHYVENGEKEDFESLQWYCQPIMGGYYEENILWFHTRETVGRYLRGNPGKGYGIFREPVKALQNLGRGKGEREDFTQFSFFNYYQRPALREGKSIQPTEEDNEAAQRVTRQVVDILRPRAVIFLSKKAWNAFGGRWGLYEPSVSGGVAHPCCAWWNRRKNDGSCGSEQFQLLLKQALS